MQMHTPWTLPVGTQSQAITVRGINVWGRSSAAADDSTGSNVARKVPKGICGADPPHRTSELGTLGQ